MSPRLAILVFASGFGLRLAVALAPIRWLMQKTFPDDAFMYWQVARNILAGNGPSLDGINLTTAYHPLWMLPALAVMAVFDTGGDLPLHVLLVVGALADMATAWLLWKAARLLTDDKRLALGAVALFLFNPYQIGYALSGLGDGLNALCLMAYFYFYLKLRAEESDRFAAWVGLGLLAGLSMLARTDSVFFHVAILLHLLVSRKAARWWDRLRAPLIVGLASCVLVVPWLLYMHGVSGHFMQTSATAHVFVNHARHALKPLAWKVLYSAGKFAQAVFWNMPVAAAWGPLWVALALLALGRRAKIPDERLDLLRKWKGTLLVPLWAMLALAFVHGALRWFIRQWYFLPMAWLVPLWLVLLWHAYGPALSRKTRPVLVGLLLGGLALTVGRIWVFGNYPWQVDMYDMAHQIAEVVPRSEKPLIGGFNILAQAYYNPNQVMNLDGIGNDAVMKNIREGTLGSYIEEVGLRYIVDWDYYIQKRHGSHLPADFRDRLRPLVACGSWGSLWKWKGPLTLYEILPEGKRTTRIEPLHPCKRPK